MSGYIGNVPTPQATQSRDSFTATAGQTSFATSGYSAGGQFLDVHLNGVKLQDTEDYTATNGSDVVLTVGAGAGDALEVVSFSTFEVADVYTRAEADAEFVSDPNSSITVDGSGNVGIGTAAPSSDVDILGSSSRIRLDGSSASFQILSRNTADSTTNALTFDADSYTFNRAGSTKAVIDSSGNVGIGVTPTSKLHIGDGGVNDATAKATDIVVTSDDPSWLGSGAGLRVVRTWLNTSWLQFLVSNGGARTAAMGIDASGRVTTPYQPAFKAGMNAGTFATGVGSSQIIYDTSHFDRGGHYNTSTGRYTVPVTGLYEFTHNISARAAYSGAFEVKLFQNGVEKHRQFTFGGGFGHGATATAILLCSQGDYIDARGYWGTSGITLSGDLDVATSAGVGTLSYFSGYLIG